MKSYAQNGEDLIIADLANKLGIENGLFIELGAGDGSHFSNCKLLRDLGWNGVSIDANNHGNHVVKQAFITRENVLDLIKGFEDANVLSIDLDGNDFWILAELLKEVRPEIICLEVNSQLPIDSSIAINYDAERSWDGSYAYGMCYNAAFRLLIFHGYYVVAIVNDTNIIACTSFIDLGKEIKHYNTWSHPETMPEKSYWVEITTDLIKNL